MKFTRLSLVLVPSMLMAGSVFAAVPPEVTTAIDTMKTDGAVIAAAVLVAVIAVAAVKFLRKAL